MDRQINSGIVFVNGDLPYYMYVPESLSPESEILVSVHGISRNAYEHAVTMLPLARAHTAVLIAPYFCKQRFRGYQRLERYSIGPRPDIALLGVLTRLKRHLGLDDARTKMVGFSGGAQFAHRFAMLHAEQLSSLALIAAGWYTWPDAAVRFPFGTKDEDARFQQPFSLRAMLGIPINVYVGEHDVVRERALRSGPKVDARQGINRHQRARRWVNAIRTQAAMVGEVSNVRFRELPDCGHHYLDCVDQGKLVEALSEDLAPYNAVSADAKPNESPAPAWASRRRKLANSPITLAGVARCAYQI